MFEVIDRQNKLVIYGINPCLFAIKNKRRKCSRAFVTKEVYCKHKLTILDSLPSDSVRIVESLAISKMTNFASHQGFAVIADKLELYESKSFFSSRFLSKKSSLIVCLDGVTDTGNFGAIIRNAVLFGADCILISKNNSAQETANVTKSACGCFEMIPIVRAVNLSKTLSMLKKFGYWSYGLDCDANTRLGEKKIDDKKIVAVLGSEEKGIRDGIKKECDFLVKIDMKTNVIDSLNVASAGAIFFYELSKNNIDH